MLPTDRTKIQGAELFPRTFQTSDECSGVPVDVSNDGETSHLEHDGVMESNTRTYRFVITVEVDLSHPAYDDPEWAADAAHGALTNEYGLRATYADISEIDDSGDRSNPSGH